MGQDGKGLALAVFAADFLEIFLASFVALEEELRCFGKGPAQMSITDLLSGRAHLFAVGLLGALDLPTIGGELLPPLSG